MEEKEMVKRALDLLGTEKLPPGMTAREVIDWYEWIRVVIHRLQRQDRDRERRLRREDEHGERRMAA